MLVCGVDLHDGTLLIYNFANTILVILEHSVYTEIFRWNALLV